MNRLALIVMLCAFASTAHALPKATLEHGTVPQRNAGATEDMFLLGYYDMCSGDAAYWDGYCGGDFGYTPLPPQYGTCFDLADCPGDCRHLEDVWFACKRYFNYGGFDVEVYCADESGCPSGSPLAGLYGIGLNFADPWQHFDFGGVPLCACEEQGFGKFIIMFTHWCFRPGFGCAFVPYSDVNLRNIENGCETEWRCEGHSFVYRNLVSYCDTYGVPAALWLSWPEATCSEVPTVPEGCHDVYYDTGFYAEWLVDCHLSCQGPTQTVRKTWSGVKSLYR